MECKSHNKMSEYQLRQAAGKYWLLHMEQKGIPYERPLQLNSVGANMWKLLQEGNTTEQMVECLTQEYEVTPEEIREDIKLFYQQLGNYGIFVEG